MNSLLSLVSRCVNRRERRAPANRNHRRPTLEILEDRTVPSVYPNDPEFPTLQWGAHNTGQTGGQYDADIDMPAAWSITTGNVATVVAILDLGVDYTHPDLYLNTWLNQDEIPVSLAVEMTDTDGDGLTTFRDLNAQVNASHVTDLNANGFIDGGDLLSDSRWENGLDDDGNGRIDDLIGWDFHDDDNDPQPTPSLLHGTAMAEWIGAIGNNGSGKAGINWSVQMMPIRMQAVGGLQFDRDINNAADGLDYAVGEGAAVSNNSWLDPVYSLVMYDAIARAGQVGHLLVAAAGNSSVDADVTPNYPAAYDIDNIISVAAVNEFDQLSGPSNFGLTTVDLAAPSPSPGNTSTATAHTSGVAALLKSQHPEWSYSQIKARILATVDPLPALAGKTVTGGRLNAAQALATTSISISDPTITEGDSGTSQLVFAVTRVGDDTGTVTLNWTTAAGTALAGSDYVAASGQITFLPSGGSTQTIAVSIKGDLAAEGTETFFVTLSVASGNALLADEDAQATILDTDTKFYVVNDATTNFTYEYSATGTASENYSLTSANTAPRGAASNAAGNKVWVVDANKTVYVYNPSGGLLGSWSAGSMQASATPEGIATNGTDVWIVDSKSDKVFKYTGAATRLSGSQNAASSFSLNSGNKDPKGIVTDGVNHWVVNDSTSNKVFKYTLTGSLVGSWTIDAANATPTGITLDPTNVSHLWIVDNGTDRVYQYDNAAGRTSGSQAASMSFALAAGNTNPQDIADPPVAGGVSALTAPRVQASGRIALKPRRLNDLSGLLELPYRNGNDTWTLFEEQNQSSRRRLVAAWRASVDAALAESRIDEMK